MSPPIHSAPSLWSHTMAVVILCCVIACLACLLGLLGRPIDNLSSLWPANAIVLGAMLRFPKLSCPAGWFGASLGFLLADALIGSAPEKALFLLLCNLASIGVGYWALDRLNAEYRTLRSHHSIPHFILAVLLAASTGSVCGGLVQVILGESRALESAIFWLINETATYVLILPVFLTLPERGVLTFSRTDLNFKRKGDWRTTLPTLSLIASCALCSLISGPGAVAFMVPSLLWCALRYRLFSTAVLTLVASCWALLVIEYGAKAQLMIDMSARTSIESVRIAIALIALAPLTVASVMAGQARLLRRLNDLARHDQLTGLLNRRAFTEQCTAHLQSSNNRKQPLAMLMLDLDHFKTINDTYGHQAGDTVLRSFAAIISRCLREDDIVGRIGGEEFAVMLPECSHEQAQVIAERIRSTYAGAQLVVNEIPIRSTVSIGAITLASPNCALEEMLLTADKMLYQAKNNGRNRVEVSQGLAR